MQKLALKLLLLLTVFVGGNVFAYAEKAKLSLWSKRKNANLLKVSVSMWSHLGLNQGPPDYESDALTN